MLKQLTEQQIAQLRKDPRIKELWATQQERELNVLEKIMLHQIVSEITSGAC